MKEKYKEGLLCALAVVLDCSVQLRENSTMYGTKDLEKMGEQLDKVGTFLCGLCGELGVDPDEFDNLTLKLGITK